ncbi:MAG: ABC transporter substrate-binding protein [Candidatus Paceibacterota bacterium]
MKNKIFIWIGVIVVIFVVVLVVILSSGNNSNAKTIKIGVSAAMTGSAAYIGESYTTGLKAAQQEINAQGGINGKPVELLIEDNKNDAQEGITVFRKLELQKPDLFITTMSTPSVPVSPLVQQSGIPLFVSVVFADIVSKNENSISFFPTPNNDAHATVQDMVINHVNKIGVLYLNSEYGQAGLASFLKEAAQNNISVISQEAFLNGVTDYSTPLAKVLATKPQAVYIIAVASTPVIKQVKVMNSSVVIYTNLLPVFGNLVNQDKSTFEGVHLTASPVSIPGTAEYNQIRNQLKGVDPANTLGYTAIGYDNLYSIKAVLTKDPNVKNFVQTFSQIGPFGGIGGSFVLDSRDVGMVLYPVIFKNGVIQEVK